MVRVGNQRSDLRRCTPGGCPYGPLLEVRRGGGLSEVRRVQDVPGSSEGQPMNEHFNKRLCGCPVPFDAMCEHDVAYENELVARQIDSHPAPGSHHTYVLPSGECECGLVWGSPEYHSRLAPWSQVVKHRRYAGDFVVVSP